MINTKKALAMDQMQKENTNCLIGQLVFYNLFNPYLLVTYSVHI